MTQPPEEGVTNLPGSTMVLRRLQSETSSS